MTLPPELQGTLVSAMNEIVATLLSLLVAVVIPYGLVLFRTWVKAKKKELEAKVAAIDNTELRAGLTDALERVDKTAETVIAELEATLKSYDAAGKVINPDRLKAFANGRIRSRLLPTAKAALIGQLGEEKFDKFVISKVEQKVLDLKLRRKEAGCTQIKSPP